MSLLIKLQQKWHDLPPKRRQWLWFMGLWLVGLLTVTAIGSVIKFGMSLIEMRPAEMTD